jgi:hypothetical protein
VAIAYNLYVTIGDSNACTEFKLLKVKVPIVFLGTEGFLPCRDGSYPILSPLVGIRLATSAIGFRVDKQTSLAAHNLR